MRSRAKRPAELDDPKWLAGQYATKSAAQIARDLDINPQMAVGALVRHGIARRSRGEEQRRRRPLLHDRNALEDAIASTSVREVASALGVTVVAVHAALARQGGQSAHRFNGRTPMTSPDEPSLVELWELEGTVAVIGDVGGYVEHLRAALASVGVTDTTWPDDLEAIQLGDLFGGRDDVAVAELVGPHVYGSRWTQLVGNWELEAVGGPSVSDARGRHADPEARQAFSRWHETEMSQTAGTVRSAV